MSIPRTVLPEEFALSVVQRLRRAGFEALFAGGCVRDRLMGIEPKDYDVATSATPSEVQAVFGRRRTVPVGESFGVILVVGPNTAGTVEVATFRQDLGYSDGRRPDAVQFGSVREDAWRRDFTINAVFFDPVTEQVIDLVGGEADLRARLVRAVGEPHQRFSEDRLRMLRGVRFAATLDFRLEEATRQAIAEQATAIQTISAERIAAEMRRILGHQRRATALQLLRETKLLPEILPELSPVAESAAKWEELVDAASRLPSQEFTAGLATLLIATAQLQGTTPCSVMAAEVSRRWKLTREEAKTIRWLGDHQQLVRHARTLPWSGLQRVLVGPSGGQLLDVATAFAPTHERDPDVLFCRHRLEWPPEMLNPPELLTGDTLIARGFSPGPRFRVLLDAVRDAQLDGKINTVDEAWQLIERMQRK